jgi:hypothetical protein
VGILNFTEACSHLGLENEINGLKRDMASLAALTKAMAPVVGITGTKNGGKTSTVKKFLSDEGRRRAPTGNDSKKGTQRFVFWLPTQWKTSPDIWQAFKEGIEALFGNQLEELSHDSETAAKQYNGMGDVASHLGIPLIAFDTGLDQYGFALMDSPDMETEVNGVELDKSTEVRLEFVCRALRGLSAILVLSEAEKVSVNILKRILPRQVDVPVFLLLNKNDCREGQMDAALHNEATRELIRHLSASCVHAAYHGLYEGARKAIGDVLGTDEFDSSLPHFYRVEPPPKPGEPAVLLEHELAALEPAKLWHEKVETRKVALKADFSTCMTKLEATLDHHRAELTCLRDEVVGFVRDQVVDPSGKDLAIPLMPETAEQIASAIIDHSPIYARPTMFLHGKLMAGFEYLRGLRNGIKAIQDPGDAIREKAGQFKQEIASRAIPNFNPTQWAKRSRNQKFMPDSVSEENLVELWKLVGSTAGEIKVDLDPDALKTFATALWREVPWWKKISLALLGPVLLIGALAALVLAMLDGGATSVVLFFSVKELLATLGLTALATASTLSAAKSLEADLIKRSAIPFYTALLKSALDTFGLPRNGLTPLEERFANTGEFDLDLSLAENETPLKTIVDLSGGRILGEVMSDAITALCKAIPEVHPATPST